MAVDTRFEWNSLFERLHKDAGDKKLIEQNLPKISEAIKNLSNEQFRKFNPQLFDKVVALKGKVVGKTSVSDVQAQILFSEIDGIYQMFKAPSQPSTTKPATTASASASQSTSTKPTVVSTVDKSESMTKDSASVSKDIPIIKKEHVRQILEQAEVAGKNPKMFAQLLGAPGELPEGLLIPVAKIAGRELEHLVLEGYEMTAAEAIKLFKYCPCIKSINLGEGSQPTLSAAVFLAFSLLPNLTSITLSNKTYNKYGLVEKNREAILEFLEDCNKTLETLTIDYLTSNQAKVLVESNPNLRRLRTEELFLNKEGSQALQKLKFLREINLSGEDSEFDFDSKGEEGFIDFLCHFPELDTVVLPATGFKKESFEKLSKGCPNLKFIYFAKGELDKSFLEMIDRLFPKLEKLYLNPNGNGMNLSSIDPKLLGPRRINANKYSVEHRKYTL